MLQVSWEVGRWVVTVGAVEQLGQLRSQALSWGFTLLWLRL